MIVRQSQLKQIRSSLAFYDADAFNRIEEENVLPDYMIAVEEPFKDFSQRGQPVAFYLIERGQRFSHQRLEEFPSA
jgi:hypothetical protein